MDKRNFNYPKKDSYTQEDLDTLLTQHSTFVGASYKDYVSKEEYDKVQEELKPFKEEKRNSHLKSLVPSNANIDEYDTLLALSKVSDEDDDDTIKSKFEATVKAKSYLQKSSAPAPEASRTNVINKNENKIVDKFKGL